MNFRQFCGGKFWDHDLTWNTIYPDLTDCFQSTALVWIPCGFLLLVAPIYVVCYLKHVTLPFTGGRRPKSWMHRFKQALTCTLVLIHIASLVYNAIKYMADEYSERYPVYLVSPAVQIFTFVISAILLDVEGRKRLVTSGVHFLFYLLLLISSILMTASLISRAVRPKESSLEEPETGRLVILSLHSTICFIQFILFCFADRAHYDSIPIVQYFKDRPPCPETQASFLSRLTYSWLTGLVITGYKKKLSESDLWSLNPRDVTEKGSEQLQKNWNSEVNRLHGEAAPRSEHLQNGPTFEPDDPPDESTPLVTPEVTVVQRSPTCCKLKPSLLRALLKTFGGHLLMSHVIKFVCDVLIMVGPLLQGLLIDFIENSTVASPDKLVQVWKGYLYTCLFLINSIAYTILFQQVHFIGMTTAMRINASVIALIYKKSLCMSSEARKSITVGEIVNLMSVDSQRLQDSFPFFWMLWSSPFQILLSLYFLWGLVGPAVLAGVAVIILFIPVNAFVASLQKKLQVKQMKKKDERIKLMNEILNGIKVLKLYAWEMSFEEKVDAVRNLELETLRRFCYLGAFSTFAWSCAPFIVTLATFATFILTGGILDAKVAFTALSFFNILRFPITVFPMVIMFIVMAAVSLLRIEKFLQCHELSPDNVQRSSSKDAIAIRSGTFAWGIGDKPALKDINLAIAKGSLTAVVGQVGSGKSSLVSAMLGDMEKLEGTVNVDGSVAYVSQQAWIQNATLRDNILFGRAYQKEKYEGIVEACALNHDLTMLPGGDMTEIGEKGINLSGGQKQRVSLARSLYQDSDIYLFDDPLSAVDSHVAKHIFNHVIGPAGYLKNKTRVLVTHGITWLPACDVIVVMSVGGVISECGHYDDLLGHNSVFAQFIHDFENKREDDEEEEEEEDIDDDDDIKEEGNRSPLSVSPSGKSPRPNLLERMASLLSEEEEIEPMTRLQSHDIELSSSPVKSRPLKLTTQKSVLKKRKRSSTSKSESSTADHKVDQSHDRLIQDELLETGNVKLSVYSSYARSLSPPLAIVFLVFFILYQAASLISNFWLSVWTNDPLVRNASIPANNSALLQVQVKYLVGYGGFGFLQAIFILIYALVSAEANVKSARVLHRDLLSNVLKSPMSFFDTTPIGRILNRFSKDVEMIDNVIITIIKSWLTNLFGIITTVIVITYTTPLFLLVIIPVLFIYYFVQRFYIPTTRQLKRLESTTRSPIYVHFSETISGASVIRAYQKDGEFIRRSQDLVDNNMVTYFSNIASNRWLGVVLDMMGGVIILCAALFAVIGRETLSPSIVGLSLSYALQITMSLTWIVRMSTQLETNIVSVERIKEYTETPTEADWHKGDVDPPNNWPHQGGIKFKDYGLRYRPGLDLVLKEVNFDIRPGEKIGVVGRTGAGKSSLTLALFRLIEPAEGGIFIDDVDVSKLALYKLRSNLTILPQDPVLFSGTIRMNLDPTGKFSDDFIWEAVDHANMTGFVKSQLDALDHECTEGGQNMSVGQRQLLCLGRTLLHKTSILILDEATAAVDLETDKVIQETIRTQFSECTVITIAHRINTILTCDRILVMDNGRVAEFDSPQVLLADKKSSFYLLARDAGLAPSTAQ